MFDTQTYIDRRQKLKQQIDHGVILLLGNNESGINYADNTYPFRQDSTFLYYCGLDKPGMALIIDIDRDRTVLLGADPTIDNIIWTGSVPSLEQLASSAGIKDHQPYENLTNYLQQHDATPVHFLPPYRPEHTLKLQQLLSITPEKVASSISEQLIQAVINQRIYKSNKEIAQIEKAVSISANMHMAAMQQTRLGMTEYEVMSIVHQRALAESARPAFPIILTKNGHILHNHGYENTIEPSDMILCDAGAETSMHYGGDLTRTFPAGKAFTPQQRTFYQIVLNAQQAAVKQLQPGVPFIDIHFTACRTLAEGLIAEGLMKGDPAEAVKAGAHTLFFQCGLGHLMGLDTHDMKNLGEERVGYSLDQVKSTEFGLKSLRFGRPLESGFVVTVEPGIYIIPELIALRKSEKQFTDFINYKKLENLQDFGGIRIEDDYLITDEGARLLGDPLPKEVATIEDIRQESLG